MATVLTVDVEPDILADGGRDAVPGDAHVDAHVEARHTVQAQHAALHVGYFQKKRKRATCLKLAVRLLDHQFYTFQYITVLVQTRLTISKELLHTLANE